MKLSAGKEDPVEFDSSLTLCSDIRGVVIGGSFGNNEIPLLLLSLYLSNDGGTAGAGLARLGSFGSVPFPIPATN